MSWPLTLMEYTVVDRKGKVWEGVMAVDLEGIVGSDNMAADRKEQVISILRNLPQPATTKRFLFARWARLVGFQARPEDIDRVALWSQGG